MYWVYHTGYWVQRSINRLESQTGAAVRRDRSGPITADSLDAGWASRGGHRGAARRLALQECAWAAARSTFD